ncbi:MAG: hypothetical protein QM790_12395 [Nibricoccus sp.]
MSFERPGRPIFETAPQAASVTFDDGKMQLNLPYHDYVEACWTYREPDTVTVKIAKWIVTLRGHNMDLLFAALEEQSLQSVKARPELALDLKQEADSYVTEITFLPFQAAPSTNLTKRGVNSGQPHLKPQGWEA